MKKVKGHKLTTGRFDTREELVDKIIFLYNDTSCSNPMIACNCKISETTVARIIKREMKQKRQRRY